MERAILQTAIGLRNWDTSQPGPAPIQLGGHPNLPKSITWPNDRAGRPMHLLMQIDCARLPKADPDFPNTGVLFFFVTGSSDENDAPELGHDHGASAIVYHPEPVDGLPQVQHPPAAPDLGSNSIVEEPQKKSRGAARKSLMGRLLGRKEPRQKKESFANSISPVALEAVAYDSHPAASPEQVFRAQGLTPEPHREDRISIRPNQMLGYAPTSTVMKTLNRLGAINASVDKEMMAYEFAAQQPTDEQDVLLLQLAHDNGWNIDLISAKYALQFRIKRSDLRARVFEDHWVKWDTLEDEGRVYLPRAAPDADVLADMDYAETIALKPLVPGEPQTSTANYFCGLPQLPADIEWPRTKHGAAMHFLAQLDCASIPTAQGTPDLPDTGTLYVFQDMFDGEGKVIYANQSAEGLPERPCPDDCAPLIASEYEMPMMGPEFPVNTPEMLADVPVVNIERTWEPKVPFQPETITVLSNTNAFENYEEENFVAEHVMRQSLPHEEGAYSNAVFALDWLPNWFQTYEHNRFNQVLRLVPQSYPYRWDDIRNATYEFVDVASRADQNEKDTAEKLWPEGIQNQAYDWYVRAAKHNPLDPIPAAQAEEYRTWLIGLDQAATSIPKETEDEGGAARRDRLDMEWVFKRFMDPLGMAGHYGAFGETMHWLLHDPTATDVPDFIREVATAYAKFQRSCTDLRGSNTHHVAKLHTLFPQAQADHLDENEVALFRFTCGNGIRSHWGDCCDMQITIDAYDLAAGRFDNCTAKILW